MVESLLKLLNECCTHRRKEGRSRAAFTRCTQAKETSRELEQGSREGRREAKKRHTQGSRCEGGRRQAMAEVREWETREVDKTVAG